ncbi:MAG: hypothetical protein FJX22_04925 [Alphaproteobacteria bacterium]|nr:hypothetical protein [Alphaproteobacteria bacterium]
MPLILKQQGSYPSLIAVDRHGKPNEDRVVVAAPSFAVIDGATALSPGLMAGLTPAAYCAEWLRAWLVAEADSGMAANRSARDSLVEANREFGHHLQSDWPAFADWEGKTGPSAAAILVRGHDNGQLSWAGAGDSYLLFADKALSEWFCAWQEAIELLDYHPRNILIKKLEQGLSPQEALKDQELLRLLREERANHNVTHPVFNGEQAFDCCVYHGTLDPEIYPHLVLMSDGLAWPEAVGQAGYRAAAKEVYHSDLPAYYRQLKNTFDADPGFTRYPRFKHMDDATALVLEWI